MSECEICGRPIGLGEGCCPHGAPHVYEWEEECLRLGYERTLARADRYQAEFAACKALLIAAQQRAERAEAERAAAEARAKEAEERADMNGDLHGIALEAEVAAEQRASEARALALREAAEVCRERAAGATTEPAMLALCAASDTLAALAALPVEPARLQVTETANALGAPSARSPATPEEER